LVAGSCTGRVLDSLMGFFLLSVTVSRGPLTEQD
jgi:hypothetical protein